MAPAAVHWATFFILLVAITSGSSIQKERLPSESIKQGRKFDNLQTQYLFQETSTMRDTYPTPFPYTTPETPTIDNTPPASTDPTTSPPATTTPTLPTTPTSPTTSTTPTIPMSPATPTTPATPMSPTTPMTPTTPSTPTSTTPTSTGGSWCVASQSASETALQVGLDYACGYGGADCSAIQQGGSCYNPDTVRDHASYAFNSYYQKNPAPTSCDFGGTAQLTNTDPSSGSCHYPSASSSLSSPSTPSTPMTPVTQTPMGQSPPSPPSPMISTTPYGGTYGEEPIASPNMASSIAHDSILILTTTVTLLYTLMGNCA